MRSRYSAFMLKDSEYLSSSWHPSTRPVEIDLESDPIKWLELSVIKAMDGGEDDLEGMVIFRARFEHNGQSGELVEKSRFVREDGTWFYLDGEQPSDDPGVKVGRNESCPCGSGKKYKRCCGA